MKKLTRTSSELKDGAFGRPSKYLDTYPKILLEYFDKEVLTKDGKLNYPPTLYGFAKKIGVCHDTLHEWAKHHPDFSEAMRKAKAAQAQFIIDATFTGKSNPAFCIFMMKNICGWRDKTEVEQNISIKPTIIEKIDSTKVELTYTQDKDEDK